MAQLVSINIINSSDDSGGGLNQLYSTGKPINGECAVNVEWPRSSNHLMPNGSSGMKKSPTMISFCSKRSPVNVQWKNINLTTKKGTVILKQLSGAVYSGELTAIMGPSGAGKTSLLNVLSGCTRRKVTGEILVNGVNREMRIFRKLACYILQDDHILPQLTVREIVSIAASLKIPSSVSRQARQAAVEECLRSLGLTDQQQQKAGQLSGGQRKRLCIAQELVSNPPLIFLDEPTSGLDSSSCLQCIQLLKSLADEGRTIVCTIHQPSSKIYEIFDKLYMLAGGQCIYRGTTKNLVPFLAEQGLNCPQYHNPTDYVTEVAMGGYGDWNWKLKKVVDSFDDINGNSSQLNLQSLDSQQEISLQASTVSLLQMKKSEKSAGSKETSLENMGYATSQFNQFRVLLYRSFLCILREPMNTQLKFIGNTMVGLLLGILYYDIGDDAAKVFSNSGLLFCLITFLIFTAKVPTILTFPTERVVFEREHMNGWYSTLMYYLAKSIAEIPFQLLFPVVNCTIVYWMSGQPSDLTRFSLFLLSAILVSLISQTIGQLIGAGSDVQKGVYLASVSTIPTLLFCGFFVTLSMIPWYLRWLSYISYARYAFQGVVLSTYSLDRSPLHCNNTSLCIFVDPVKIIKELEMEGELYINYSALLGFFIFFRIITYFVLKLRVSRMQQ